jgi:hypothetical protein
MTEKEWRYRSLGEFLAEFLAPHYCRQVTDKGDTVWCPEPWLHPEALRRLGGLWLSHQHMLWSTDLCAEDNWWTRADRTMELLFDPSGPFKYCSVRGGHKEMLAPLPMRFDDAPPALFAAVSSSSPSLSAATPAAA